MKTAKLRMLNKDVEIGFSREKHYTNGNLFVRAWCVEGGQFTEPWCDVTKNFDRCAGNCAYLDTNNCSKEIIIWLRDNGYFKPTDKWIASGYCNYPEVEFTDEFLNHVVA